MLAARCWRRTYDPNATLAAIAHVHPDDPGWHRVDSVPRSASGRRRVRRSGAIYLGARGSSPRDDEGGRPGPGPGRARSTRWSGRNGAAVRRGQAPDDLVPSVGPAPGRRARRRRDTLAYLSGQGIDLKVISGEFPVTSARSRPAPGLPGRQPGHGRPETAVDDDEAWPAQFAAPHRVQPANGTEAGDGAGAAVPGATWSA